ncbi:MAG: TSUP family transporter [Candidatus Thalassarchaeaceae archaeon]|nr:TSUP family transporter [Candidatus Thalassarchaeaceae archaeon]
MLEPSGVVIIIGLFLVAALYSSVGHGGGSGYLAILSLTSYGVFGSIWLKQYAWSLNLIVAGIAFYHYHKAGHHILKLTIPFIVASIPFAMVGGYLEMDGVVFDLLLTLTFVWAAYRLYFVREVDGDRLVIPEMKEALPIGASIGFVSGIVGIGGGIFLSPTIHLKKWATPKATAATAALFIWMNSAAGLLGSVYSDELYVEIDVLAPFAFAVLLGGVLGSRFGSKVASQNLVKGVLVGVLLIAAARRAIQLIGI